MNQRVNTLKGMRQMKKDNTTVPSISTTCFLARELELSASFTADVPGSAIKCLAIMAYRTTSMQSGSRKNTVIIIMKKKEGQNVLASVRQAGTSVPSMYSRCWSYLAINSIGLRQSQSEFITGVLQIHWVHRTSKQAAHSSQDRTRKKNKHHALQCVQLHGKLCSLITCVKKYFTYYNSVFRLSIQLTNFIFIFK